MSKTSSALLELFSFGSLPDGWNYGVGQAPSNDMLSKAADFIKFLIGLGVADRDIGLFPGTEGEILIRAYDNDTYLGFLFEIDGSIELSSFDGTIQHAHTEIATLEVAQIFALKSLAETKLAKWFIYDSSIPDTLTSAITQQQAWPSKKPVPTISLQSYYYPASSLPELVSATISPNIIQGSEARPLCFAL